MNVGNAYQSAGDFEQAIEYHNLHLRIAGEVGNKAEQGSAFCNLGNAYDGLGDVKQAIEYHKQHLAIAEEVGDRAGQGRAYGNLGNAYQGLGDFKQSIEYHKQDLSITKEVGDRAGQERAYGNLAKAYQGLGDFKQATEYLKQDLSIAEEVGDRAEKIRAYGNLGNAHQSLGDFKQALEYHKLCLEIAEEVGNRAERGYANFNLGYSYKKIGDFKQAIECQKQCLTIAKEVGDRKLEGCAYGLLGNAFQGLGDFTQARKYHKLQLSIAVEVGDRAEQRSAYGSLGFVCATFRDFRQATKFFQQSISIAKEIGDKSGEIHSYHLLGKIRTGLGDLMGGIENFERCLKIAKEVGDEFGKGVAYCGLGRCHMSLDHCEQTMEYLNKRIVIANEVGDKFGEGCACSSLGHFLEQSGCLHEALVFYRQGVKAKNDLRCLLQEEDVWKINFRHMHQGVYTALWRTLVSLAKTDDALCAAEQGRAQALMDLMQLQYGFELLPSASLVEKMISNVSIQTVFVALEGNNINLWLLCKEKDVQFRQRKIEEKEAISFLENLRKNVLKENDIVGRSLDGQRGEVEESSQLKGSSNCEKNSLRLLHDNVIGPIANLLHGDELIIVPDGPLCLAPFAAFMNQASRHLSESRRIRIIPSLTSLKLIKDCPEDYHVKGGALLVGDPCVEEVIYLTGEPKLIQLPCAKKEVKMIGKILKAAPLTGKEATKAEVLKRISSVALVHIAAHGNRETGEIALAPNPTRKCKIPEEKDYILQIEDVQAVQIRARLVVLSCCHSGQGEVNAEGVVGIARAFLGAGARSVLVSLWAIDDEATLVFMTSFYQHMRDGNSASVSLNRAMKFLRESEKFSAVKHWAPFVLIGDDVTLEVEEQEIERCK